MKSIRILMVCLGVFIATAAEAALVHGHFDIAPQIEGGALVVGGLAHDGGRAAPPVYVFGFEFGEDPFDPFNPADPGINQTAGFGSLPAGAALRYNILSSLRYWDGDGEVVFATPPGSARLDLLVGASLRTLAGDTGAQPGSLIQTVLSDGSLHRHFVSSLYAGPLTSNVPGEAGYAQPVEGIYAFGLELTLAHDDTVLISHPVWIVYNHGLDEAVHEQAMEFMASQIPEPASAWILAAAALLGVRRVR